MKGSMNANFFYLLLLASFKRAEANTTMNFTISHLWNSAPVIDHRPVQLAVSSSPDNDYLLIEIDAPFFNNPPPSSMPPGPFPELWNYEVVELFFLASSTNHYIELEFSPHGHYLILLLIDRRKKLKDMLPLSDYQVTRPSSDRWTGRVQAPRAHFPAHVNRFNAYAIHGHDGNRTYEALYPAPSDSDKPDFHRLELFQPIDFESLLNVGENDGDSWSNGAPQCISYSSLLLATFCLIFF